MNAPTLTEIAQRKQAQRLKAVLRKISDNRQAMECKHLNRLRHTGLVPAPTQADYERIAGVLLNRGIIGVRI